MFGIPFIVWFWVRRVLLFFLFILLLLWIISAWARSPVVAKAEPIPDDELQNLREIASANNDETAVVVVGGGASGLMAAYTLKYLGLSNVTILEASSQFGGRTVELTNFSKNVPLDLGAEWLHYDPSILQELILFADEIDIVTDQQSPSQSTKKNLPETIVYRPKTYQSGKNGRMANWIRYFYTDYKFRNTTWHSYLKDFIYPYVANGLRTNSFVDTIDYSDGTNNKIQIKLRGGTEDDKGDKVVIADKVIMATPVSILQDREVNFIPTLPDEKWEAIDRVEFAPGLKVWLVFSERFYADWVLPHGVRAALAEDKLYFDALFGKGIDAGIDGDEEGEEHILALFEVGDRAVDHINMSGDEIVSSLLVELDAIYDGQATRHYTGKFHVQNWSKQNYVRGAYSYNWREIYDYVPTIQEPIKKRIYFAGEYTVQDHPATVVGAALSGRRAALRLVRNLAS